MQRETISEEEDGRVAQRERMGTDKQVPDPSPVKRGFVHRPTAEARASRTADPE